ncbi:MAG: hypothetical protein JW706_04375, partial [Opitutales bacterium]|nr:hypothetical protein [Opitutales bacterium]
MIASGLLPERALSDTLFSVSFPATLIHLDRDAIAGSMGYAHGVIPEHFRGLIDDAADRALALSDVQAGYRLIAPPVPPSGKGHQIRIDSSTDFDTGPRITSLMKGASLLCCFALTIGPAIDNWIHQLS